MCRAHPFIVSVQSYDAIWLGCENNKKIDKDEE